MSAGLAFGCSDDGSGPEDALDDGIAATSTSEALVSTSNTALAVMSPWHLRTYGLTDAQQVAFENQMVADLKEAKVTAIRLEIGAPGEAPVDLALYRRLLDKLPSDIEVIAVLGHALVEGGVSGRLDVHLDPPPPADRS